MPIINSYSNSILTAILEGSDDLILALNKDYQIIACNLSWQRETEKLYGKYLEVGMDVLSLFEDLPEQNELIKNLWTRAFAGESFVITKEFGDHAIAKGVYEIKYYPLYDNLCQIIGAAAMTRTVTERYQAEQEIKHLNNTLTQQVQERTLDLFNANKILWEQNKKLRDLHTISQRHKKRYQTLIQATYLVVWTVNEDFRMVESQPSWEAFTGQSFQHYQNLGWLNAIYPDDRNKVREFWQQTVNDSHHYQMTYRLWHQPTQSYRMVLAKGIALLDSKRKVQEWIISGADIDDLKKTQEALRESQIRFQTLAEMMPQIVWTSHPDQEGKHIGYVNRRWTEYSGKTLDETQNGWVDVLHPDDLNPFLDIWTHTLNEKCPFEMEYRLKRLSDGEYRWHLGRAVPLRDEQGKVYKWLGTSTDIHDIKMAQEELQQVTERLNLTLKAAQFGCWAWDIQTDQVIWDEALYRLHGITVQDKEITSFKAATSLIPLEDKIAIEAKLVECFQNKSFYQHENRVQWPDKSWHVIETRGEVLVNEQGEIVKMLGIACDVTAKKQLEQERLDALRAAKAQEELRAREAEQSRQQLKEFTDTIFHEIRNPLQGIYGGVTLLKDLFNQSDQLTKITSIPTEVEQINIKAIFSYAQEYLKIISDCAEQQKNIIDTILDFSKLEQHKIEAQKNIFELNKWLTQVILAFKCEWQAKKLQFNFNIEPSKLIFLKADTTRLTQVIQNLLSNAIKYTEKGKIDLRVIVKSSAISPNVILRIELQDTGFGMTDKEQLKLFHRFSQISYEGSYRPSGSGLGLWISKKLVEEILGGNLSLTSEKGVGTLFCIEIPCEEVFEQPVMPELSDPSKQNRDVPYTNIQSFRILIVEDNPLNLTIIKLYLEQRNYSFDVAFNGQEAYLKHTAFGFDLILMDLEMPQMGGLEATQLIRAFERQQKISGLVPVIGLSGNVSQEYRDRAIMAGMNDYLSKPVHRDELYKMLENYLSG